MDYRIHAIYFCVTRLNNELSIIRLGIIVQKTGPDRRLNQKKPEPAPSPVRFDVKTAHAIEPVQTRWTGRFFSKTGDPAYFEPAVRKVDGLAI